MDADTPLVIYIIYNIIYIVHIQTAEEGAQHQRLFLAIFLYPINTHSLTMHKSYTILMSLELGLIEIKYQGLGSHTTKNPFQQSSPLSMLIFLTAIFCHALASLAPDSSSPTTLIIFHLSGVVGCEVLLWVLLTEFWWWYLINLFLLLVTSLCFSNCVESISRLFRGAQTNAATHPPNSELQDHVSDNL